LSRTKNLPLFLRICWSRRRCSSLYLMVALSTPWACASGVCQCSAVMATARVGKNEPHRFRLRFRHNHSLLGNVAHHRGGARRSGGEAARGRQV